MPIRLSFYYWLFCSFISYELQQPPPYHHPTTTLWRPNHHRRPSTIKQWTQFQDALLMYYDIILGRLTTVDREITARCIALLNRADSDMLQFMQYNINHCDALKGETYRLAKEFGWLTTPERLLRNLRCTKMVRYLNIVFPMFITDPLLLWKLPSLRRLATSGNCWILPNNLQPVFRQSWLSSYDRSFQPGLETGRWSPCGLYLCPAWMMISTTSYLSLVSQRNWWSWWQVRTLFSSTSSSVFIVWLVHDCYFLP